MGSIVEARCSECGYTKVMFLGGGLKDNQIHYGYPALNSDQTDIEVRNKFNKEEEENKGFIFYDSKSLYDDKILSKDSMVQVFVPGLQNANYFCPKCKKYNLSFLDAGSWC